MVCELVLKQVYVVVEEYVLLCLKLFDVDPLFGGLDLEAHALPVRDQSSRVVSSEGPVERLFRYFAELTLGPGF